MGRDEIELYGMVWPGLAKLGWFEMGCGGSGWGGMGRIIV